MRIFRPLGFRSVLSASFLLMIPTVAFAGGGTSSPAPAAPKPVPDVKVWTNEDVEALGPRFEAPAQTVQPQQAAPAASAAGPAALAAPIASEQNPQWYAQQLGALESQLADVSAREEALRNFRATSKGLPTGLNVVAPCQGVGTDNLIAQLDARRQELLQQIDAVGDTARENDMPPGILVEGRGRVSAKIPLTPAQQRAALVEAYRDLSDELAQTQDTVAAMQSDAASRSITLIQPDSRWGGNLTTNMQQNLYSRQSELQSQISAIQDQAQASGAKIE
jgi:hypothetical protein